jgi:nucleoside-diphosphate-sugar epimerase
MKPRSNTQLTPHTTGKSIGASGNIGAAVLEALVAAHPEIPIEALVRSEQDAAFLRESYPESNVTTSLGSLEDLSLLEEKASQTDIVISALFKSSLPPPSLL